MTIKATSGVLALCCLFMVCSSVRQVRPLDAGVSAITASVGGPVTLVGKAWLPLPLLSVGYTYGLHRRISIEGGISITSALFGIAQGDAGINWCPLEPDGVVPGITITPKIIAISNFKPGAFRWYPTLTPTLYWDIGRNFLYTGAENWFELHTVRSDGNPQPHHWLVVPYLGYGLCRTRWQFQIEARVYTPNLENTGRATKNIGFGDHGVFGGFVGISRTIGGKR